MQSSAFPDFGIGHSLFLGINIIMRLKLWRVFCNKEGSPVCINCSSFYDSSHSLVISIMDLSSLRCVINRVNTMLHIAEFQ